MLQIHDITEFLDANMGDSEVKKNLHTFIADGGASFDFGDVDQIDESTWEALHKYSCDLIEHDMFRLPYPTVYYSYEFSGITGILATQTGPRTFELYMFAARKNPFMIGLVVAGQVEFVLEPDGKVANFYLRTKKLFQHLSVEPMVEDVDVKIVEEGGRFLIALTALMQSNHTRTRKHDVGLKLNQKREKRGLAPIMPYHTVYFEVGGKNYGANGVAHGGGCHASPRMHWRRGHVRKLESGKIAHVRPHLVGGAGASVQVAKPKYELKVGQHA